MNDASNASTPTTRRVLVVATADVQGEEVFRELAAHTKPDSDVKVVVPIPAGRLETFSQDDRKGRPIAEQRLANALAGCLAHGIDATGAIGDLSPTQTIDDEIAIYHPDELVIVMHSAEESTWSEHHLEQQAHARFELPITVVHAAHVA